MPRAAERALPAGEALPAANGAALRRPWRRLPEWQRLRPPEPTLEATIVMPVRNEAAGLRATLEALARQRDLDGRRFDPRRYEVIVLANNCTDASAEVVRRFAARRKSFRVQVVEVTFPKPVAHVGHARRVLMDEACRRLERSVGERGVIVSTDGDTIAAPDWLAATLAEIAAGADAVGGRIALDGGEAESKGMARLARRDAVYQRLRSRLEHLLDPDPADPWPRHHQHFGASLALTVHAYRRVGGLPPERFLEDEALYQSLRVHDLRIRHSRRVQVVTSSRRDGRVDVGLSWQLRVWADLAEGARRAADPLVADPAAYARELLLKRRLRACWQASCAAAGQGDPDSAVATPDGAGPTPAAGATPARGKAGVAPAARSTRAAVLDVAALAETLRASPRWLARQIRVSTTFGSLWREVAARRARQRPLPQAVPMREAIASLRRLTAADASQALREATRRVK